MSDDFLSRRRKKVNNFMRLSLLEHILACKLSEYYMAKSYRQTFLQYNMWKV